jgi:hypothetical protein
MQVCNPHGVTFHKTLNLRLLETSFERYVFHGSHRWINSRTLNHMVRRKITRLQNYLITKYGWQRILKTCVPNSTMIQHILWNHTDKLSGDKLCIFFCNILLNVFIWQVQWKPFIMITLGLALFHNNNRLITLSGGYKNLHYLTQVSTVNSVQPFTIKIIGLNC